MKVEGKRRDKNLVREEERLTQSEGLHSAGAAILAAPPVKQIQLAGSRKKAFSEMALPSFLRPALLRLCYPFAIWQMQSFS